MTGAAHSLFDDEIIYISYLLLIVSLVVSMNVHHYILDETGALPMLPSAHTNVLVYMHMCINM